MQLLDYRNGSDLRRDRRKTALKVALVSGGISVAAPILLYVAALIWVNCEEAVRVRLLLADSGDWDVVEVTGYYEGNGPSLAGYSVTGALLAAKGRPEATVRLVFNGLTSLRDNEEIRVVEMKDLKIEDVQRQLLRDPRMSDRQRYQLKYHNGAIDVKSTGHFGQLFPRPIRDLKDLRAHYDEVYQTMRSIAARPSPPSP